MELIAIQPNVLVNPNMISVIEKVVNADKTIKLRVTVDNRTLEVTQPEYQFMEALNKAGVDLTKQFFAV